MFVNLHSKENSQDNISYALFESLIHNLRSEQEAHIAHCQMLIATLSVQSS